MRDRHAQGPGQPQGNDIELSTFFRNSHYLRHHPRQDAGPGGSGGSGQSLAQVMGGANGHVEVAMTGGSVSSLMVSLAGLQLFDALILYVTGDNRIPILCAVGRMNFQQGTVTFDRTLLDTQKSILHVNGPVALQSQVVNVEVKADPKSFDLARPARPGRWSGQDPLARRSRSAAPSRCRRR